MKPFAALFLALTAVIGQAQVSPDSVTIHFQLASRTGGEEATLVYSDFLRCDDISLHPITDREGQWEVKLPASRTLHIQIWDNNKIEGVIWGALNLFCRPGTKAEILLDDINDRCIFTGENAEAHNAQIRHPLRLENFHGRMFGMDMQEAARHIRSIHKDNTFRIDTLVAAHPDLPSRYVEALRQLDRYAYASEMTQNVLGHIADSLEVIFERGGMLPQEYVSLLREVETDELLHPQELLPCDATMYFRDVPCIEEIVQGGIIQETPDSLADKYLHLFSKRCAVIDTLPAAEEVKQFMKTRAFVEMCDKLTPERESVLRQQLTDRNFHMLRHYMNAQTEQHLPPSNVGILEETPMDSLTDGREIFHKLIAPYRGRVLYVDVWGTWCGPCRSEMEHLPELHAALEGLDVVYIYLANRSPEELWRKASRRFGLEGADCVNLRLPDDQQRAVEQYLGVSAYPTYLLVAPDGTIATGDAPRPSQPFSVRQQVEELLGK